MKFKNISNCDSESKTLKIKLKKLNKIQLVMLLTQELKVTNLRLNGYDKVKEIFLIEQILQTKQFAKIEKFIERKINDNSIISEISLTKFEEENMAKSIIKKEIIEVYAENIFLDNLKQKAIELNLFYNEKDLINFHVAMKVSKFVILAGMSGSGKSKLVKLYAETLGVQDKQLQFIPVRPSWADDTDLIGYVDSIHNIYVPADSGLVDIMLEADNNKDKIYIVCLDEMNLARVEHYFSQFLSVLEMEDDEQVLSLYNSELESKLYNANKYPSNIKIGKNILFVGTVNIDESTYHFSDKVLDRANVINLSKISFKEVYNINKGKVKIKRKKNNEIRFIEYNEFIKSGNSLYLDEIEVEFLDELHDCINAVNKNFGVGFRVLNQISKYLINIPGTDCDLNREEGFDIQIVQRILTKIRGPRELIEGILGTYVDNKYQDGKIIEILNKYKNISEFNKARDVIKLKTRELEFYGYTM